MKFNTLICIGENIYSGNGNENILILRNNLRD